MIKDKIKKYGPLTDEVKRLEKELILSKQNVKVEEAKLIYNLNKIISRSEILSENLVKVNGFFGEDLLVDYVFQDKEGWTINNFKFKINLKENSISIIDVEPLQQGMTTTLPIQDKSVLPENYKEILEEVKTILGIDKIEG